MRARLRAALAHQATRTALISGLFTGLQGITGLLTARWLGPADRGIVVLAVTISSFAVLLGGATALLSHLVKAGMRAGVNTSPEPVSNVVVSTAEDVTVAGVIALAVANPWIAAGAAGVLLLAGAAIALYLTLTLRRLHRSRQDRRAQPQRP